MRDIRADEKIQVNATFDLWSGGNIRLNGLDLTLTTRDAEELFKAMKTDDRFQIIHQVFFDEEKEDWKVGSSFLFLQLSPSVGPHRLMS